jgi:hypothetical protein
MGKKLCEQVKSDGVTHRAWLFWCPGCTAPHQCDHRWGFNGDQEKPTFTGSVLIYAVTHGTPDAPVRRPRCHSFVEVGKIRYLPDSTHAMAGKTVELPDWEDRHSQEQKMG